MEMKNIYTPEIADIVRTEKMTEIETLYEVRLPGGRDLGHGPGQFVQVSCSASGRRRYPSAPLQWKKVGSKWWCGGWGT